MLRYSEVERPPAGERSSSGLRVLGDKRAGGDLTEAAPAAPDVVLAAPARALPQHDRHAVGRTMRWMGHLLDAASLTVPLVVLSRLNNGAVPVRIITLFGAIGTVLLWNTHKRGRTIVGPS